MNDLKSIYFSIFGLFLPSPKLIFPFILGKVLNYWTSFSLFWVSFSSQHLLVLSNFFFFLKARVIKLLKIYLILKINILIYREGAVRYSLCNCLIIKPQIVLHHAVQCTITCDAMQLCHFASNFGAIFAVCTIWWTLLLILVEWPSHHKTRSVIKLVSKNEQIHTQPYEFNAILVFIWWS